MIPKDFKLKEYDVKKSKAKARNHAAMGSVSIGAGLLATVPMEMPQEVENSVIVLVAAIVNYGLRLLTDWLKHK